jgi:hypothetical protein
MKKINCKAISKFIGVFATTTLVVTVSLSLYSFSVTKHYADEFLKQLGITRATADSKLNSGFLFGSFDEYGLSKAKNIITGNRAAIVKDVTGYARKYVASPAFITAYNDMRLKEKPEPFALKTPEQMQSEMIEEARKGVAEAEASLKKADASLKPVFEKIVAENKKQLAEAESPNNKRIALYRKNYAQGVKTTEQNNSRLLADWEAKYPANHMLFIKTRLQQFLDDTKDIDFNAELVAKNGKKYFVNKAYESKGKRWKMAFRAGKEAVETARLQAEQWIAEIK